MTRTLVAMLCSILLLPQGSAAIVVAYESGVPAYDQAIEGVTASLGKGPLRLLDLRAGDQLLGGVLAANAEVVIVVGSKALQAVQEWKPAAPVIATMVFRSTEATIAGSRVDLDVPLETVLSNLRGLMPACSRVGIVRNPSRPGGSAESLENRARKDGFTAVIVECDGPAKLLKALTSLKGKVDVVLCSPDPDLYNPVTIKPLVLASFEQRLPLVGFSSAMVQAGAAAGVYPDYRDVGRQAGEMAQRLLRGDAANLRCGPRKVQVAVNQRVARLLGIQFRSAGIPMEVFR